jgi:hypothetical protein
MNSRDIAALDLAVAAGLVTTTTGPLVAGQSVEQSVFEVVAYHLGRCRARVDDLSGRGRHQEIAFATVSAEWRDAWRAASGNDASPNGAVGDSYPMAILSSEVRRETLGMNERPASDPSDASDPPVDWISPDDLYALWDRGEEDGEARVIVYATYQAHARALQAAVEVALRGATGGPASFPLPEGYLPTPFQGAVAPALYPRCLVEVTLPSFAAEREEGVKSGAWRADVRFAWRANALVARPRTGDYDPRFFVTTTEP